ncbi:PREDICTED: myb/SANT-like DNA-binding domain-containing protein 2 [Cyprinodon variegatus]|uniref:myb/SANT-like DNA-binding domain-containing protein 2 n=1 Tax=Cyprinodon variegatus TaxID=28743 RepID=UPI0007426FC0|nr:PREDICTED: myb/SANT-like DNA-binding domain-containing protein 2 [Cyprinodon variegatus]
MASKDRGATWDDAETEAVIAIWAEDVIQEMLKGAKHNHKVFKIISDEMKVRGYDRDPKQCREKIKKLRTQYKKALDHNNTSGGGRKTWKFYGAMDKVLGLRASSRSPVLFSSTSSLNSAATKDDDATPDHQEQHEYSAHDEMDDEQFLDSTIMAFLKAQKHSHDLWMVAFKEQQESAQRHQLHMIQEMERNRLQAEERLRKQQQEHEMRMMQMIVQLMTRQPAQLQPLNPASPSTSVPNFSN